MDGARGSAPAGRNRPVFGEDGHLTPSRYDQMRKRLNATGLWSATLQSEMLARQLGHSDVTELWSILLWNTRPGEDLARKLQRWFATGMPLGTETADPPLARAS